MLAMTSERSARTVGPSVAQGPAGQVQEDVFQGGPPDRQVLRLDRHRLADPEEVPDRGRHVARVEQVLAVVVANGCDRGDRGQAIVAESVDAIELDRLLLEPA